MKPAASAGFAPVPLLGIRGGVSGAFLLDIE